MGHELSVAGTDADVTDDASARHPEKATYWSLVFQYFNANRNVALGYFCDSFEWFAYPYMERQIAQAVFGGNDALAWFGWSMPLLTAPMGGVLFGIIGDSLGRKTSMLGAAALLTGGTLGEAFTPNIPGVAPAWMITFRCVQGLAYGGKFCVGNVFLAEMAPKEVLAMSRAVILLPIAAGFMILSGVALPLYALLRRDRMLTWGWRVPFLVASVVSLVPLWLFYSEGRETEHFEEMRRQRAAQDADPTGRMGAPATIDQGLLSMVQRTWKVGAICTFGMAFDAAFDGLGDNFVKAWLVKHCAFSDFAAGVLVLEAEIVYVPACLGSLMLADTIGLGKTGLTVAALGLVLTPPTFLLPYFFPGNLVVAHVAIVGMFATLHGMRACFMAWSVDLFPADVRSRALGFYTIPGNISTGIGPVVCTPWPFAAAGYCLVCAGLTFGAFTVCLITHYSDQEKSDLKVGYLRTEPY